MRRKNMARQALSTLFSIVLVAGLMPVNPAAADIAGPGDMTPAATSPEDATTASQPTEGDPKAATDGKAETSDQTAPDGIAAGEEQGASDEASDAGAAQGEAGATENATPLGAETRGNPAKDTDSTSNEGEGSSTNNQGLADNEVTLAPQSTPSLEPQSADIQEGQTADVSRTNTSVDFATAGTFNTANLAKGVYRLTAWGAQGGNAQDSVTASTIRYGGKGGKAESVCTLDAQTIYAVTGGAGQLGRRGTGTNVATVGGANGGGRGGAGNNNEGNDVSAGGSGGGATHFSTTKQSLASIGLANIGNVLIVAGGGGGAEALYAGGAGGGAVGGDATIYKSIPIPKGGSQVANSGSGIFGAGKDGRNGTQDTRSGSEGTGGGGAGYWGGNTSTTTGTNTRSSGAGGSGFLNAAFTGGTKASGGASISQDGRTLAATTANNHSGGGTARVEYLASVVTLDAGEGAATTGDATLLSAPAEDAYYQTYSTSGLQDAVTSITIPTRTEGIRFFAGYYTGADRGGTRFVDPDGTIEAGLYEQGSTTLYAAWGIKVSFDASGVAADMPQTQTIDKGEHATKPADPTAPSGLAFKGWSSDPVTYTEVDFDSATFDEDTTLYAFWTPQVSFEMNGHGKAIVPQFLVQGSHVVEPAVPTEEGHTFLGWFKEPTLQNPWSFEEDTTGTEDMTLYAKWAANEYTVRYLDNGVYKGESQHTYGIEKGLATAAELGLSREGWTFAGWRAGSELKVNYTDGEVVKNLSTGTGFFDLNAVWKRDVTFASGIAPGTASDGAPGLSTADDALVTREQLFDGTTRGTVTTPDLAHASGWRALGWLGSTAPASEADLAAGMEFTPQEVTSFYGLYSRDLTLAFDGGGAEEGGVSPMVDVQRMNSAGSVSRVTFTLPSNGFTRAGWRFSSWDLGEPGETVTLEPAASEGAEFVARAQWDGPYQFTIAFDANDGDGTMDTQVVPEHTTVALAENAFTREGYEFTGWNTAADGSGDPYDSGEEVEDLAEPGQSITLYAQWEELPAPTPDPDPTPDPKPTPDPTPAPAADNRTKPVTPATGDASQTWPCVIALGAGLALVTLGRTRRTRRNR